MVALRWIDGWIDGHPAGIGAVLVAVWLAASVMVGVTVSWAAVGIFTLLYWLAVALISALTE